MQHLTRVGIHAPRWIGGSRLSIGRLVGVIVLLSAGIALFPPKTAEAAWASPGCVWHTVVPGDTLGNLGWTDHSTASAIAQVNHIADPDLIYVGQRLCILPPGKRSEAARQCMWHTVVPGDTLAKLARDDGSRALTLARTNHIADPDLIYVGQRLCLVAPGQAVSAAQGVAVRMSPLAVPGGPAHSSAGGGSASGGTASGSSASGVQAFIQFVLPYARAAHAATGWPTSLILAQWGLEQGWHVPSYTGYNFGNCGAIPGEPLVPGLNVPRSPAAFSYAPTPADGVRIYSYVAHLRFYAAVAPAAAQGDVDAAARALGQSPWDAAHYTATGQPGSSLLTILHTYNLYWYDAH